MTKPNSPLTAAKLTAVQLTPRSGIHVHRPAKLVPDTGDDKTGSDTGGFITPQAHTATLVLANTTPLSKSTERHIGCLLYTSPSPRD